MHKSNPVALAWIVAAGLGGCGENDADNCLVARACCVLADEEGASSSRGAEGCEGHDVEWGSGEDLAGAGLQDQDGVLTLLPNTTTRVPVVWITSTGENKVAKFDSVTGEEVLRVPTWGSFPNRTAVASDGSVWITNRDSYQYVHIGVNGDLLCSSPQGPGVGPGYTRAAALDSDGFVWIGLNDTGQLLKVDPTGTDGTVDVTDMSPELLGTITVPRCLEITTVDLVGPDMLTRTYPYGLAGDGEGHVWVGVLGSGPIAKVDTATGTMILQKDPAVDPVLIAASVGWGMYGMALDLDGNPWFANLSYTGVIKVDKATGNVIGVFDDPTTPMLGPRAMGLDRNGHIWVSENSGYHVDEFLPDGTFVKKVDTQTCGGMSPGTLGTGSDIDGNMWTVLQNAGKVVKFSTDGTILGCYPEALPPDIILQSPYTYSDLTGSTLALVTSGLGRWRGIVQDAQDLHWLLVAYQATVPANTGVCTRVRTATSAAGLETAPWTQPYCESEVPPAWTTVHLEDADGLPIENVIDSAFLEIELQLSSSDPTLTPQVSGISVAARAAASGAP